MAYSKTIPYANGGTLYAKPVTDGSLPSSTPTWATDIVATASSNSLGVTFTGLTDGQSYWVFEQAGGSPLSTDVVYATFADDSGAAAADQTTPAAIRAAIGLESANLASLVNAVVGKNVVTNNGNGTYDIAVRNAADDANLVIIRYNPTTGTKTVL